MGDDPLNPLDSDNDGLPDYLDQDSDNDELPDSEECGGSSSCLDADNDGIPDYREPNNIDTDNDGTYNHEDPDDDGDGIPTATEGTGDNDDDGIPNYLDPEVPTLFGDLTGIYEGDFVTYTLVVTCTELQTNVVVTGSIPNNGMFVNVTGGESVSAGGDYGVGYVVATEPSLAPGERITLVWVVQMPRGELGRIATQGHARSDTSTAPRDFDFIFYRVLMPIMFKVYDFGAVS